MVLLQALFSLKGETLTREENTLSGATVAVLVPDSDAVDHLLTAHIAFANVLISYF